MDMTHLRSLLAVTDTGAITPAAERLGLTQPALSRRPQHLEEHLGAELLSRGRKGVELTEIGKLVAAEARILIARYDRLREQIQAHQGLEDGVIRLRRRNHRVLRTAAGHRRLSAPTPPGAFST